MPDLAEASQLFDIDVDQVTGPLPLVGLDHRFGLQIPQPPETKASKNSGHRGEGSGQQPGDIPEVQAWVAEIHGLLLQPVQTGGDDRSGARKPITVVPAVSGRHWGGYAWVREVWVDGSHLNP